MGRKKKDKKVVVDMEHGYVRLVATMLLNVYDRIRIKDSWKNKKISQRMKENKKEDLEKLGVWLHSEDAEMWFNIFGASTGINARSIKNTFIQTHKTSEHFIKTLKDDDEGL